MIPVQSEYNASTNSQNTIMHVQKYDSCIMTFYVPRKKRKHSSHLVPVSQCTVFTAVGADISTQFNCANPNCTLYKLFEEQLITEGIIKWRLHEQS